MEKVPFGPLLWPTGLPVPVRCFVHQEIDLEWNGGQLTPRRQAVWSGDSRRMFDLSVHASQRKNRSPGRLLGHVRDALAGELPCLPTQEGFHGWLAAGVHLATVLTWKFDSIVVPSLGRDVNLSVQESADIAHCQMVIASLTNARQAARRTAPHHISSMNVDHTFSETHY